MAHSNQSGKACIVLNYETVDTLQQHCAQTVALIGRIHDCRTLKITASGRFQSMVSSALGMVMRQRMILRILNKRRAPKAPVPQVAEDERIYAIGDVHGRHDLLLKLFSRIHEDAVSRTDERTVRVILLGDYVDRGDDSAQVLEALRKIDSDEPSNLMCLMGNHEAALLSFVKDPVKGRAWLEYGAAQTLASYGVTFPGGTDDPDALTNTRDALVEALGPHLQFMQSMPTFYRSGAVLFVHAGVNPEDAESLRDTQAMLWGHPGFLTPAPVPGLRVVHGHYDDIEPQVFPGRVCIDTGAYYSGVLTALRLDEGEALVTANAMDTV